MTPKEFVRHHASCVLCAYPPEMHAALNHLTAELARVTHERDRLIEAWPTAEEFGENRAVEADHSGDFANWTKQYGDDAHKARAAAVRAAAGLDAREGE